MSYPIPDLTDLATALSQGRSPRAIGGVVPAARALALAGLARVGWRPKPLLVVVPHVADAHELVAGLELLAPELSVGVVPADGAAPYQGSEPPLASRLDLVQLIRRLASDELDVVAIPTRALTSYIPDPAEAARLGLEITPGDSLDGELLAEHLVGAGYRRVDLVEEAGEFALRGWVADVHTGGEHGLRIELDDDRVESVRPFDPSTQRSVGETVEGFEILPLDPFPATAERRGRTAAKLEDEFPALASMMREGAERRLWWSSMHLGSERRTWLDVCDQLVVCDRDDVLGELGRWNAVQAKEWHTLAQRSVALPSPSQLVVDPGRLAAAVEAAVLRVERLEVEDGATAWWRVRTQPVERFVRRIPDLVPTLRSRRAQDLVQILVVASEGEGRRFEHLLREGEVTPVAAPPPPSGVSLVQGGLQHGFVWEDRFAVYGRRDLTAAPPPRRRTSSLGAFISDLRDLKAGDLVVHVDHGIGRFGGFRRVEVEGRLLEMMVVEYRNGDSLLVPVERADLIQKYSGADAEGAPRLDRLGGSTWQRRRARVKKAVREMAAELLRLAAARRASEGHRFSPDSPWQREFEDAFEYELTPDQERAVAEIKDDMESLRPMDRLLCGDVGYGKTEVSMRAAFKAVLEGKQVAVLAPTTILVEQHRETFARRFAGFPVEVRMLSRFVGPRQTKVVLEGMSRGTVDVVVGTHRLLTDDVVFRDLGLVIIDEEQRFGVAQKERLKRLRTEVDVLSMSATPIPRTLNMALSGLRDISLIETPPRDRQAVETTVLEFSEEVVREAVLYEVERGGQVFFVHNRVKSIGAFADWLRRVVPEARFVVAHGQMSERSLEKAMRSFLDGEADVLLATAIIENGLDIPSANTLLVNRADRFGLAQLYQLRGRVGRSDRLAYAYFLVPPGQTLSTTSRARLAAIQEFCQLGAGFRIAARDLEIRGAGNMLGAEQHGFLEAVGFETYCQLLEEAVAELEGRPVPSRREVELHLGRDLQLPEDYIPEPALRLTFYKRLASCPDEPALGDLLAEVADRYGPPPPQIDALGEAQRIRLAAQRAGLLAVSWRRGSWVLRLDPQGPAVARLGEVVGQRNDLRVAPSGEIRLPVPADTDRMGTLFELLQSF